MFYCLTHPMAFKKCFIFIIVYGYVHVSAEPRGQKRALDPQELKVQAVVST